MTIIKFCIQSESGFYQCSPGPVPDFVHFESGSGFYQPSPGGGGGTLDFYGPSTMTKSRPGSEHVIQSWEWCV